VQVLSPTQWFLKRPGLRPSGAIIFVVLGEETMKQLVVSMLCTVLFLGCSSFPKYDKTHNTLLVGEIIQTGKNYPNYSGATVNGIHKYGIVITIQNQATNTKYQIESNSNGIFKTNSIPSGDYILKRFYYKNTNGNSWSDIFTNPNGENKFTINDNSINNLGLIEWNCDADESMLYYLNKDYSTVKELIEPDILKLEWSSKSWLNLNCKK
jgi:hypothetical protein